MASLSSIWAEIKDSWAGIPKIERAILDLAGREQGVTHGVLINRLGPVGETVGRMLADGSITAEKKKHSRNKTEFTLYRAAWRSIEAEGCERIFDITKMRAGDSMPFVIPYRGHRIIDHIGVAVRSAELDSALGSFEFTLNEDKKTITIKRVK